MPFVFWVVGLLLFSTAGSIHLRRAGPERYAPFIYTCALWWACLPALAGDWLWTLLSVPVGLVAARYLIRRRAVEVARRGTSVGGG